MKYSKKQLDQLFENWGKKVRQTPERFEKIKSDLLSYSISDNDFSNKKLRSGFRFSWFILAGSAVVFLIVITKINFSKYSNQNENRLYSDSSEIGSGLHAIGIPLSNTSEKGSLNPADLGIHNPHPTGLPDNNVLDNLKNFVSGFYEESNSTPITDDREFLKTNYGAYIKSRAVQKLSTHISTIIRGYGGRIDTLSINAKNSYIQFVLPKSSFTNFKSELSELVSPRFLNEKEQSTNVLPIKKNIEIKYSTQETTLNSLQLEKQNCIKKNSEVITELKKQLSNIKNNFSQVDLELKIMTDTTTPEYRELLNRRSNIYKQQTSIEQHIVYEDNNFKEKILTLDSQIKDSESSLVQIKEENQTLIDDVETISGSVSIEWISIFDSIKLYVPLPILFVIFVGIIILIYYFRPRKSLQLP